MLTVDWSILDDPEVLSVMERAVRFVAVDTEENTGIHVELEDLRQEARIILATKHADGRWRRIADDNPYGILSIELTQALQKVVRTPVARAMREDMHIDAYTDEGDEGEMSFEQAALSPGTQGGMESRAYDRQLVELLMPAVWDEQYAYGMEVPTAPDKDMPKTQADPKKSNTLWAHLADIRSAWKCAPLTFKQRRALLMRFGLDWEVKRIGAHEGVDKGVISRRIETAVGKIVNHLNGTEIHEAAEEILEGV